MLRWMHDVVAGPERQLAEHRLEGALPFHHVDALVRLGIAIEVRVVLVRLDVQHPDVGC